MNEINKALDLAVRAACARHGDLDAVVATEGGALNTALWSALEQMGVTTLSVPERLGGSGGDVGSAVTALQVLGEYSAAVPVAETALSAGRLLARANVAVPPGPLTLSVADEHISTQPHSNGIAISGVLSRVPWARQASHLVVLDRDRAILLEREDYEVAEHVNLAGEPRDDVVVDSVLPLTRAHALDESPHAIAQDLAHLAALARSAMMVGAGRRALELSITYASEREQFGRPIAKFQAVQQHLATMAGEVLLAKVAVEAAALTMDTNGDIRTAAAGAKTVAGQMAALVARLAHQIHGALGYTEEHPLRHSSTRLWAWRDEAGSESAWSAVLGRKAITAGTHGLWPLLTSTAEGNV